jgi:hypothetical protein
VVELIKEFHANRIEPSRDLGWFAEPALPGQDVKVGGLELYADVEGDVIHLSEMPADRFGAMRGAAF